MSGITRVLLAKGLSVVLPGAWEYYAESDDGLVTYGIGMRSPSCSANFELLNNASINSQEFVANFRFSLMKGLIDLGAHFLEPDPKHLNELIATMEGIEGKIFHSFLPSKPVVHISAIYQSASDLIELRLIRDSVELDMTAFGEVDDEIVALELSNKWQRSAAIS